MSDKYKNGSISNDIFHREFINHASFGVPIYIIWLLASTTWIRLTLTLNTSHEPLMWWNYLQASLTYGDKSVFTAFITKVRSENKVVKMSKNT